MTDRTQKLLQAATCLLCAVVGWRSPVTAGLAGTEFSGGRVTGPILDMHDIGTVLFPLSLLLTFVYPRVAAGIALAASVLSLPLYLYLGAPGPFRWVVRGNYKVPLQANFYWNNWTIAGIVTLALATYVCISTLRTIKGRRVSSSSPGRGGID